LSDELHIEIVGIVWYRRDQYELAKTIMVDGANLPPTYSAWLHAAQQVVERVKGAGKTPVRAYIDPATFPIWCQARGLDINADARNQFANIVAYHSRTMGNA